MASLQSISWPYTDGSPIQMDYRPPCLYLGRLSGADEELDDGKDGCDEAAQDGDDEHAGHALQLQGGHASLPALPSSIFVIHM